MQNPPTSSHPAKLPTRTKISVAEKKQMAKGGGRWRKGRSSVGKCVTYRQLGQTDVHYPEATWPRASCLLFSFFLSFLIISFFRQGPWRCVWSITFKDKNLIPKVWPPGCIYDGQWTHIASLRCLEILAIFNFWAKLLCMHCIHNNNCNLL